MKTMLNIPDYGKLVTTGKKSMRLSAAITNFETLHDKFMKRLLVEMLSRRAARRNCGSLRLRDLRR